MCMPQRQQPHLAIYSTGQGLVLPHFFFSHSAPHLAQWVFNELNDDEGHGDPFSHHGSKENTRGPQPPEELVSESSYILSPASFSSLYNGKNRTHSQDCFHSFNKHILGTGHRPGTVLGAGDTILNAIIPSCPMELSLSDGWDSWKEEFYKLQRTMYHYEVLLLLRFPSWLMASPSTHVQAVNLGIVLNSSLSLLLPTVPSNHHSSSDSPSEKSDM